jgi:adenylyltransferase/sulfurtransferase
MRYSRQEKIIGKENQKKLSSSTIAIVGLGATGSSSAELLTRAGIKNLIIIDRDYIEESNLQRQHLFTEDDINKPKAEIVEKHLKKINSKIKIKSYFDNLDEGNINLLKSDIILDCTDNLTTRFLINEYSIKENIPWIYSAAIRNSGYIFNSIPGKTCLKCFIAESSNLETCETSGIMNTISTLISTLQVNETIKILTKQDYEKDLIFVNLTNNTFDRIKVKKNKNCQACNKQFEYLTGKKKQKVISFCGKDTYLIYGNFDYNKLKKKYKNIKILGKSFIYKDMTFFKDKVMIKAKTKKEALSLYSKYIGN